MPAPWLQGITLRASLDKENLDRLGRALLEQHPKLQTSFIHSDFCQLSSELEYDLIFSDTMLNMIGTHFLQGFEKIYELLRPGGAFCFREILPPNELITSKRDLFFRIVLAACEISSHCYKMYPIELIESSLSAIGFQRISTSCIERSSVFTPFDLTQWHPLVDASCPMRDALVRQFEERSQMLADGLDLSSSYHIVCYKDANKPLQRNSPRRRIR